MQLPDEFLGCIGKLTNQSTKLASSLGARSIVLGVFLDAAFAHMTATQGAIMQDAFRRGMEDVMALGDDFPLPATFHSAMLDLTNDIINRLKTVQSKSSH